MMNSVRSRYSLLAVFAASGVILAGCGGDSSDSGFTPAFTADSAAPRVTSTTPSRTAVPRSSPSPTTSPSDVPSTSGAPVSGYAAPADAAELADQLEAAGLSPERADCAAGVYFDSGVSADGLRRIVEAGAGRDLTAVDVGSLGLDPEDFTEALAATANIAVTCFLTQ